MPDLTPTLSRPYLEPLISRADRLPRRARIAQGQKLIAININTRETRDSLPLWGADQWRRYLVTAGASVRKCEPFSVTLTDSLGMVRHDVVCDVSIKRLEPNWETILVVGLSGDATPEAAFEKQIERWLQDFVDDQEKTHPDCLRRFAQHRENAQIHLRQAAGPVTDRAGIAAGLGLNLVCTIKLPEDDLKPIEFVAKLERLSFSDYDEAVPSQMEVHLEVPPDDTKMETCAQESGRLLEDFREDFERETGLWFRRNCRLHDYCFNIEDVRKDLQADLEKRCVTKHGREITFLRVRPTQELVFPKPENISHIAAAAIDITKAGSPEESFKVRVSHKVQIETTDAAKWLRTQAAGKIDDYTDWIKKCLQRRTEDVLLGKSYGDIVVEFDRSDERSRAAETGAGSGEAEGEESEEDLKTMIQKAVERDLEAAGLSVKMFTTTPDLPVRRLLVEGFRFDTQGTEEDEVFRTSDSRVDFKMAISVSGNLKSLEPFKSYLTGPDADIEDRLRQRVVLAARDVMTNFSPKELFLNFDAPGDQGKPSPRTQITGAIENVLVSKLENDGNGGLDAVCERVVLRPLKGDFEKRWEELTPAQNHHFKLSVAGLGGLDDEMQFEVEFRVNDIDDQMWANFQNHCTQHKTALQQISAMIRKLNTAGKIRLAALRADTLRKQKTTDYQDERDWIFEEAIEQISLEMGLKVEVTSILRTHSEREKPLVGLSREMFQKEIQTAKELHKELQDAKLNPLDADEEKIGAQKEALEETFGGALKNRPALPGSKNPLALGTGDAEKKKGDGEDGEDDEEQFGKRKKS